MSDFDIEIIPKKSKKKSIKKDKPILIDSRNKTKKKENDKPVVLKNKPKEKDNLSKEKVKTNNTENKKLTITELIRATKPKKEPISKYKPTPKPKKEKPRIIPKQQPRISPKQQPIPKTRSHNNISNIRRRNPTNFIPKKLSPTSLMNKFAPVKTKLIQTNSKKYISQNQKYIY